MAAQLREELSAIISREIDDPRVSMVSVTGVDVSPDLRNARAHVSTLGGDEHRREALEALEHARGFIRHELATRLRNNLRHVPEVRFVDDRNIEYAVHISQVLDALPETHQEVDAGAPEPEGG